MPPAPRPWAPHSRSDRLPIPIALTFAAIGGALTWAFLIEFPAILRAILGGSLG